MFCISSQTGKVPELKQAKPFKTSMAKRVREMEEAEGRLNESFALVQLIRRGKSTDADGWRVCRQLRTVLVLSQKGYFNLQLFVRSETCRRVEDDLERIRREEGEVSELSVLPYFHDLLLYPKSRKKLIFTYLLQKKAAVGYNLTSMIGYVDSRWDGRISGMADRMFLPMAAIRKLLEEHPEEQGLDRFVAEEWSKFVKGHEDVANKSPVHCGGAAASNFGMEDDHSAAQAGDNHHAAQAGTSGKKKKHIFFKRLTVVNGNGS